MRKLSLVIGPILLLWLGILDTHSTISTSAYTPQPHPLPYIGSADLTHTPTIRHSGVVIKKDVKAGIWIRSLSNEKQHHAGIDGIVFIIEPRLKAGDRVAVSITRVLVSPTEKTTAEVFLQCRIHEWSLPKTVLPVLPENQKIISVITERLAMVIWNDSDTLLVARTSDNTIGPPLIISYICASTNELVEGDRVYFLYGKTRLLSKSTGAVVGQQILFQLSREKEPESDMRIQPTGTGTIDRSPETFPTGLKK